MTIKQLRESRNYTQLELAQAIDVSKDTIGSLEIGRRQASFSTVEKLAKLYKVDNTYIYMCLEETRKEKEKC
jgi:DNA-binding XRE family transcriptional regulator